MPGSTSDTQNDTHTSAASGATIDGACHCGAVTWSFQGDPGSATVCNCTICRRYGAIWAYDFLDERIRVTGETAKYAWGPHLAYHRCATCGCVAWWQGLSADEDGRVRVAVNLRLAIDPDAVSGLVIDRFDGLDRFEDLPHDGRHVRDFWF